MSSTYRVLTLHVRSCTQPQSIEIKDACLLPTEYTDYRWMFSTHKVYRLQVHVFYPQSIQIIEACLLLVEYTDYRSQMHVFYLQSLDPPFQELYITPEYTDYRYMYSTHRVYRLQMHVFYPQSIQIARTCILTTEYTDYRSMSSTRRVYSCARLLLIEYTDYRSQLHVFYS